MIWSVNDGVDGHIGATSLAAFSGAGTAINGSLTFAGRCSYLEIHCRIWV